MRCAHSDLVNEDALRAMLTADSAPARTVSADQ